MSDKIPWPDMLDPEQLPDMLTDASINPQNSPIPGSQLSPPEIIYRDPLTPEQREARDKGLLAPDGKTIIFGPALVQFMKGYTEKIEEPSTEVITTVASAKPLLKPKAHGRQ